MSASAPKFIKLTYVVLTKCTSVLFIALGYLSILTIPWPLQDSSVWMLVIFGATTLPDHPAHLIYEADIAYFSVINILWKDDIL